MSSETFVATQATPVLRLPTLAASAMRREHLDAVLPKFIVQLVAVVGAIANQILLPDTHITVSTTISLAGIIVSI